MIYFAIAWWGCGVLGYLLHRHCHRVLFNSWSVKDRRFTLFAALLVPPSLLGVALMVYLTEVDRNNDGPASW